MFLMKKGIAPNQAHVGIPDGVYEEEHGRRGFGGPASHLYRRHPPTGWVRIEGPLRPRAFACAELSTPDLRTPDAAPLPIMKSGDAVIMLSRRTRPMPHFLRNSDGDELYFIHKGRGRFETDYGMLGYEPGDYVGIPKGTTYRLIPEAGETVMVIVETAEPLRLPERGLLGRHALFDPGVLVSPDPMPQTPRRAEKREWEVRIKRYDEWTTVVYPFYPMDVVGWKGDLWVAKLNVRDFRPVVSPRYHLPPSVHATFQAGDAGRVIISTFAPRPLESDPAAMKVPFYHRNMDYDEVLFYHSGSFFSRAGIKPGAMTLHPQGIHHGPQPQAVAASKGKTETHEVAVMIESQRPFQVCADLEAVEHKDYALSWVR